MILLIYFFITSKAITGFSGKPFRFWGTSITKKLLSDNHMSSRGDGASRLSFSI